MQMWLFEFQIVIKNSWHNPFNLTFIFCSDTDLSNILGDSILQVSSRHPELRRPACPALRSVSGAIKHSIQRFRVDHSRVLHWPLSGWATTDLWRTEASQDTTERQWQQWLSITPYPGSENAFNIPKVDILVHYIVFFWRGWGWGGGGGGEEGCVKTQSCRSTWWCFKCFYTSESITQKNIGFVNKYLCFYWLLKLSQIYM